MLVPIPPEDELKKIVVKVEKMMSLCNHLKTQVYETQTTQLHLANAIVEKAVA